MTKHQFDYFVLLSFIICAMIFSTAVLASEFTFHIELPPEDYPRAKLDVESIPGLMLPPSEPSPTVTSIEPNTGSTVGGTPVVITGTGFTPESAVTIGGNIATDIAFVSSTELHTTTLVGNKGAQDVVVVNTDGQAGRLVEGFTYEVETIPLGGEFRVNTETFSDQRGPSVGMDAAGNFVIVWQSSLQDGDDDDGDGIYAQRFAADGTPQGTEFRVNSFIYDDQYSPSVGMDADGNFVVAWVSNNQDGGWADIYAQRYAADGTPLGGEFRVNPSVSDRYTTKSSPSVGRNATGDFLIAWQSGYDIYARRYDADGTPLGGEFQVSSLFPLYPKQAPSCGIDEGGNFVIAWATYFPDEGGHDVYARRYNASGTPIGEEFRVNTYTNGNQWYPSVGIDSAGNFIIVWEWEEYVIGRCQIIYGQRYLADGTPLGEEFWVESTTFDIKASVGVDATGNFIITWVGSWQDHPGDPWHHDVYVQRYFADGTLLGGEFRVNSTISGSQTKPSVGVDTAGSFVIAWQSAGQDGSGNGIYAQRFNGGMNPILSLASITPNLDSISGSTPITLTGTYFSEGATVTIGGVDATDVTVVSETEITATTPAGGAAGVYDVVAMNPDEQSSTLPYGFTYTFLYTEPFLQTGLRPDADGYVTVQLPNEMPIGSSMVLVAQNLTLDELPTTADAFLESVDIIFSIPSPTEGDIVDVYATIHNTGETPIQNFTVSFYAGNPDEGGVLIGVDLITDTIPPGDGARAHIQWDTTGFSGDIDLYVRIDPYDRMPETNETNNTASVPIKVYTQVDLVITPEDISFSNPSPMVGEEVTIFAIVNNSGETDAIGAVVEAFVGNPDVGGVLIEADIIDILAEDSATAEITWMPETAGEFEIFISVNRDGAIDESNYSNNTASKMISVSSEAIYIDCGNDASDIEYNEIIGYGYLDGFPLTDWGDEPHETVRVDFDGEVRYRFDNLDVARYYHLDFSFYEGDEIGRIAEVWVDGVKVGEQIALSARPHYPSFGVPTETYTDGTIIVSIKRSGVRDIVVSEPKAGDIVVSELRLIPIDKIPIDCGSPDDLAYSIERGYGYLDGQPFTDWGDEPHETVRLDMDGEVRYQFDNLLPDKKYQVNFTFYEGDGGNRNEEVWIDSIFTGVSVFLGDEQIHYENADVLEELYESDGSIIVSIQKRQGIGAIVSEIALEEQTTLNPFSCSPGDVSGDGESTAYDASLILQAVVGLISFPDNPDYPCFTLENADVSGNGSLSALDAAMILQYTVGIIDIFAAQQPTSQALAYRQFTRQMFINIPVEQQKAGQFMVSISIDEAQGVLAGEFNLQKPATMRVQGIEAHPNFMIESLEQENELKLVFATAQPVMGRTMLAYITLDARANEPRDLDSLRHSFVLVSAQLNEGTIPIYWQETRWDEELQTGQDKEYQKPIFSEKTGFLHPPPQVTRTRWAVWFYSLNSTFEGRLLQIGDIVTAKDPDGVICGVYVVDREGEYGYMPVYGDNPYTEADEGATDGEELTFYINGQCAHPLGFDEPLRTPDVRLREVDLMTGACLHLSGEIFINGQPAPIGTVITAHSEDGSEIARYVIRKAGQYGVMHLRETSGLQSGEVITLAVNGQAVESTGENIIWDGESRWMQRDLAVYVE